MKIFCAGVPFAWRDDDLKRLFEEYGNVVYAHVQMETDNTNRSRGFGFVEMGDIHEAHEAIRELDKKVINGRVLKVDEAKYR